MAKKKTNSYVTVFDRQMPFWAFILGLMVVIALGIASYNFYLDYKDQQKFNEIEYTVDTLASRLEEEFGISGEYDNYCYESNEKFTKGPTICVYQKKYELKSDNFSDILDFVAKQSDIVGQSNNIFNDLDFYGSSEAYDCSIDKSVSDPGFTLECSDPARRSYYGFRS